MPKVNEVYQNVSTGRIFYVEDILQTRNEVRTCTLASGLRTTIRLDRLSDRKRYKKIKDHYRWL